MSVWVEHVAGPAVEVRTRGGKIIRYQRCARCGRALDIIAKATGEHWPIAVEGAIFYEGPDSPTEPRLDSNTVACWFVRIAL